MRKLQQSIWLIFFIVFSWSVQPIYAQQSVKDTNEGLFIKKGKILTGFSFGFKNASREHYNQVFEREVTQISVQLSGIYFLNDHIGVGPLLGYQFVYRDLEEPPPHFLEDDLDTWASDFEFGIRAGWYIPVREVLKTSSETQFFIDGGISWLRTQFRQELNSVSSINYRFGYQVGMGVLIPVGKRIALETRLGFESRRRDYLIRQNNSGGGTNLETVNKWIEELSLGVGLKITL